MFKLWGITSDASGSREREREDEKLTATLTLRLFSSHILRMSLATAQASQALSSCLKITVAFLARFLDCAAQHSHAFHSSLLLLTHIVVSFSACMYTATDENVSPSRVCRSVR